MKTEQLGMLSGVIFQVFYGILGSWTTHQCVLRLRPQPGGVPPRGKDFSTHHERDRCRQATTSNNLVHPWSKAKDIAYLWSTGAKIPRRDEYPRNQRTPQQQPNTPGQGPFPVTIQVHVLVSLCRRCFHRFPVSPLPLVRVLAGSEESRRTLPAPIPSTTGVLSHSSTGTLRRLQQLSDDCSSFLTMDVDTVEDAPMATASTTAVCFIQHGPNPQRPYRVREGVLIAQPTLPPEPARMSLFPGTLEEVGRHSNNSGSAFLTSASRGHLLTRRPEDFQQCRFLTPTFRGFPGGVTLFLVTPDHNGLLLHPDCNRGHYHGGVNKFVILATTPQQQ